MEPVPVVSICVLTRRASDALRKCLASLEAQGTDIEFELLVASDGDASVAALVRSRFPRAVVGLVRGAHPGHARNFLVSKARGDLLWFLDDDVVVPPGTLARLVAMAQTHPEAAVFGGPNLTEPGSTRFQRVQGATLASLIGAGPVRRRYRRHSTGPADDRFLILCNLAVRRGRMLPFPPELMGGEENAVLAELRRLRLPMRYDETLAVYHERRPDLRSFFTQMRKYGRGRGQAMRRRPSTARPGYLVPVGLVATLAATPFATLVTPWALAPLCVYGAAVGAQAVKIGMGFHRDRLRSVALATVMIPVMHVAYGIGVLQGLARRARRRASDGAAAFEPLAAEAA